MLIDYEPNEEESLEATSEERRQKHTNPAAPPRDVPNDVPPDHPSLDSDVDQTEMEDEGRYGASGIHDQEERS